MSDAPQPAPEEGRRARAAQKRPLPASLRRNAPLVPVDSAGGQALAAVIAILTFLAALCAGGAELVATSSAQWRSDIAREVTIQVRPNAQRSIEAGRGARRGARPAGAGGGAGPGLLQGGIRAPARALARHRPRLQRPAGAAPDRDQAPGRTRSPISRPCGNPCSARCRARPWTITPSGCRGSRPWPTPSSASASFLVALVLVAAGLAVTFATRGAMAGNREVVDVLHFVGANDDFIAKEFQRRFFRLGLARQRRRSRRGPAPDH